MSPEPKRPRPKRQIEQDPPGPDFEALNTARERMKENGEALRDALARAGVSGQDEPYKSAISVVGQVDLMNRMTARLAQASSPYVRLGIREILLAAQQEVEREGMYLVQAMEVGQVHDPVVAKAVQRIIDDAWTVVENYPQDIL